MNKSSEASEPGLRRRRIAGWSLLGLFILMGGLIRGLNLGSNPPGLWQDEASTGLDAWLLWWTGQDRTGTFLPLICRSFGDYPLALYRYLTAPIVGIGGLTIAHERWVAAIFGTLLIAAAAAVTRLGAGDRRGVAVALTCALCPTWIHFSRYGSEAILLPATLTLGWLGIEAGTRFANYRWAIWAGAVSLGLSAYTYHAVKLVLPLWMLAFLIYQYPNIRKLFPRGWMHVIGPAIVFALLVLPSVYLAFSNDGQARGRTVLAWYHYEGLQLVRTIANNYLSYFDPGMLFVRGGPAVAQSIPNLGMWNAIELPLLIIGLAVAFRQPSMRRFYGFVLFWFLLGPLPGGVTYETHNMGRAIAWLPAPQILSGTGLAALLTWAGQHVSHPRSWTRAGARATFVLIPTAWLLTAYSVFYLTLVEYPRVTERDWQFAVSRALLCAQHHQTTEKFIVSPAFPMAVLFSQFHFAARLRGVDNPSTIWDLGERSTIAPNELYAVPATQPQPKGAQRICTITQQSSGQAAAFVYRALAAAPAPAPPIVPAPNPTTP